MLDPEIDSRVDALPRRQHMHPELLRSGKPARLTDVRTDLFRHYERMGILPPPARASHGYRLHPAQMVSRVLAVR
jgi:hypothetical protein